MLFELNECFLIISTIATLASSFLPYIPVFHFCYGEKKINLKRQM